jgi:hypothetical protein
MDLEQYRRAHEMSYETLRLRMGLTHRQVARQYALGIRWPSTERLALIREISSGEVSVEAMFERRLAFLRSIGRMPSSIAAE